MYASAAIGDRDRIKAAPRRSAMLVVLTNSLLAARLVIAGFFAAVRPRTLFDDELAAAVPKPLRRPFGTAPARRRLIRPQLVQFVDDAREL